MLSRKCPNGHVDMVVSELWPKWYCLGHGPCDGIVSDVAQNVTGLYSVFVELLLMNCLCAV